MLAVEDDTTAAGWTALEDVPGTDTDTPVLDAACHGDALAVWRSIAHGRFT